MSINISDFSLFFVKKLQHPLKKVTPFYPATPSQNWDPAQSPPPFQKFGRRLNPPPPPHPAEKGVHNMGVAKHKLASTQQLYVISKKKSKNFSFLNVLGRPPPCWSKQKSLKVLCLMTNVHCKCEPLQACQCNEWHVIALLTHANTHQYLFKCATVACAKLSLYS